MDLDRRDRCDGRECEYNDAGRCNYRAFIGSARPCKPGGKCDFNPVSIGPMEYRMNLYKKGLSDAAIAEKQKVSPGTVAGWRMRKGLPPNPGPIGVSITDERYAMWKRGMSDTEIAKAQGATTKAIASWRFYHKLKPNEDRRFKADKKNAVSDHKKRLEERMKLYEQGLNDREIADAQGMNSASVCNWRTRHGLPPNWEPNIKRGKGHQ